jgi:Zn-dependent M16 (insulinase) family peptidase
MEIVFQLEMVSRQRIVSAGHVIGIRSTLAHFSAEYALKEAIEGSSSVRYLHTFVSKPDNMLTGLQITAEKILNSTICRQRLVLSLTADQMIDLTVLPFSLPTGTSIPAYTSYSMIAPYRQGFRIPARIGFAVRGFQMRNISSEFHGHWFLISNIITYSYLWNKVRVQGGAYGCGLQVDRYGNLYSYSYRDPSPHRTLNIDSGASAFIKDFFNGNESLDNYIISTLNDLNPLLSPREKGGVADSRWFTGYTRSEAERIRLEILNATPEKLIEATKTLDTFSERGAICVVGPQELLEQCDDLIIEDL